MQLKCPGCARTLKIPDSAAGKVIKCPCGKQMRVPAAKPAAAAKTPAARPAAPAMAAAGATTSHAPTASRLQSVTRTPAARPAAPVSTNAFGVDAGMFDELTETDLKPVAVPPKPGTQPKVKKPTKGGTDDYVSDDDKKRMSVNEAKQKAELAPLPQRLGAYCIDWLLCVGMFFVAAPVLSLISIALFGTPSEESESITASEIFFFVGLAIAGSVGLVLNAGLLAWKSQTLGKMICGLTIVDAQTIRRASFHQTVILRFIGWKLKCMIPFLGAMYARRDLWSLFANEGITEHDNMAGTLVVTTRSVHR
ncbi:RDD family protein [Rhodopirellula sallentina]|uniref:RDD domain-containing membrane protein n=1 Tax=Rhodopirellula sallentina SM41 TaxID=1263870 RepID=M5UBS1_9BACT|nr:RDD family protein [Rhodopirellula sallentina]EMI55296.1 RDD domain-containing membrane protein [Rhodopirellula sallentina SM41]